MIAVLILVALVVCLSPGPRPRPSRGGQESPHNRPIVTVSDHLPKPPPPPIPPPRG